MSIVGEMVSAVNKENLVKALNAFTERNDCKYGIDSLLMQWADNKQDIYKMFGNKLRIEHNAVCSKSENEISRELDSFLEQNNNLVNRSIRSVLGYVSYSNIMANKCEMSIDYLPNPDAVPNYKKGMKLSNVLRYYIDDTPSYVCVNGKDKSRREWFDIQFSKLIQSMKTKGVVVVSIDPLDYLTMSVNKSGWRSCHNAYDGEYRGGCMSYLTDISSAVGFIYDGKDKEYTEFNGFIHNSKNWRQMIYINVEAGGAVFSRQYPRYDSTSEKAAIKLVGEHLKTYHNATGYTTINTDEGEDEEEEVKEAITDMDNTLHYPDIHNGYSATKLTIKGKSKDYEIVVGNIPVCPVCGAKKVVYSSYLTCPDCKDKIRCDKCGQLEHRSRMKYVGDKHYCISCFNEDFEECVNCGDSIKKSDAIYLKNGRAVCKGCLETRYKPCNHCGEMVRRTRTYKTKEHGEICPDCLDKLYNSCRSCGRLVLKGELSINKYCFRCDNTEHEEEEV